MTRRHALAPCIRAVPMTGDAITDAEPVKCGTRRVIRDLDGRYWMAACIRDAGHDGICADQRGRKLAD